MNFEAHHEKTRRQTAETDLAENQEIFRLLVDAVEDYAIFALDVNGRILTWNLGGYRLKGYTAKEVIGTNFRRFYTSADIERRHPEFELKEAIEKGKYEEEGWRVKKDGSTFWANVVITTLRDQNGTVRGFGKVTRDLTRKRIAEIKLRESEERFRIMVEGVEDYAVFMLTPDGNVATWNKGAERTKGYIAEEIIGHHFSRFYPEEDLKANKPARELVVAEFVGKFEDEGWRIRKDGTRFWANVVITAMRDKQGALVGFSKVTRDLTERKKGEDALREAYAGLETRIELRTLELSREKNKAEAAVKARDQFFSIASHELKTPLSSLKLQVQLRKRSVAKGDFSDFAPDKLTELCEDDERQIERLAFLVDNMMDISKLTSGNFALSLETFDLSSLVIDVVKRMESSLNESGNVCTVNAGGHFTGTWDRHRMEQVLTNLLSNAGKYAPGKPVEISLSADPEHVTIEVRDHGNGIAKSDQRRLFIPFERVKNENNVSGLGLGLHISKQIVEAHQGTIELNSELGSGTTFRIQLQRTTKPSEE